MNQTIKTLLYQAQDALNCNDFKNSLLLYTKILQINPEHYLAHYNIGNIFLILGKNEDAIKYYLYTINFNKNYINAYINIGLSYTNINNYIKALEYLEKALSIEPNNPLALNNMGYALYSGGKFKEALNKYKKAVMLDSNFKEAHNGLASTLEELGNFSKAFKHYKKAIQLDKDYSEAKANIYPLIIQLNYDLDIKCNHNESSCLIYDIIHSFLNGDYQETQKKINKIQNDKLFFLSPLEQKFGLNYLKFIVQLLRYPPNITNEATKDLYHIGESHSLSFSNHHIMISGIPHIIKPLIIFGAKAFHLNKNKTNKYKSYFENYISNLKKGSLLLLSFGEIDCRYDEGIIPYHLKTNENIESIIKKIVSSYISYTSNLLKRHEIKFKYLTLHAPVLHQNHPHNALRIKVFQLFNEHLISKTKLMNLQVLDTYSITKNTNNESNKKYMCDEYHLSPEILEKLKFDF